jgi:hypothetical protein
MTRVNLKKFITSCTLTFKAFEHEVSMTPSKEVVWSFTTKHRRTGKKYCILCSPELSKSKSMLKIAITKVPPGSRLVIVSCEYTETDYQESIERDYCLTTLKILNKFGQEMLEIKEKEARASSFLEDDSDVIDDAIKKDRLF